MTLEEAIKHCEEVAEQKKESIAEYEQNPIHYEKEIRYCKECASEHRQLASWLKALKEIWDSGDCNDCKFSGHCKIQPKVGQLARFNCYHFSRVANGEVNADDT